MKALCSILATCAGLIIATASPVRADFVSMATLSPATDGAANSNGSGMAMVDWSTATDSFTYTLSWANLTGPATMAHIHYGAPGVDGPIVVPFFMMNMPATNSISGTLTAADLMADPSAGINTIADVAMAIEDGNAYVNIHTSAYPAGELRGQLAVSSSASTPEPATTGLMLIALGGGAAILARKRRMAVSSWM